MARRSSSPRGFHNNSATELIRSLSRLRNDLQLRCQFLAGRLQRHQRTTDIRDHHLPQLPPRHRPGRPRRRLRASSLQQHRPHPLARRRNVRTEVGPFCQKGLRSPAATCDQISSHFKIMSSEITAPLFVSSRCIPLTLRLAAKVLSGRKDLQKSPKRSLLQLLFPYGTRRSSTTGLLEQMP